MKLNELTWPLYLLPNHREVWEEDKVMYIDNEYQTKIVDNKNYLGDSLATRRIKIINTKDRDYPVCSMSTVIFDIPDIIVAKSKNRLFIDSKGFLFKHTRSNTRSLIYRKVDRKTVLPDGKVLCHCRDIFRPILIPYLPRIMPKYLGLLHIYGDYMLYSLEQESFKDTWRKI
tara:strand:+ start:1334 stop:1849 length:516 start_codon:yes stop_codon:yes gene_type:complete